MTSVVTKKFSLPRPDGSRTQALVLVSKANGWSCPRALLVAALAPCGSESAVTALRDGARGHDGAAVEATADELKTLRNIGGLGGSASKAVLIDMAWGCGVLSKLPGADAALLALAMGMTHFTGITPVPSELPEAPEAEEDNASDVEDGAAGAPGVGGAPPSPFCYFLKGY